MLTEQKEAPSFVDGLGKDIERRAPVPSAYSLRIPVTDFPLQALRKNKKTTVGFPEPGQPTQPTRFFGKLA